MTATDQPYDVVVIGAGIGRCAGIKLRGAGITNFVILEKVDEVIGSAFDDATHTWTLHTHGGESYRARIVIADCTEPAQRCVPRGRSGYQGNAGSPVQCAVREGGRRQRRHCRLHWFTQRPQRHEP